MFDRFPVRQVAALIVGLGISLTGIAPAWTMPATSDMGSMPAMSTSDTTMQDNCMGMMMDKVTPAKKTPRNSSGNSCSAMCAGCANNIGLAPEVAPATLLYRRDSGILAKNASPDGIASPPALPPPILRA